MRPRTLPLLTLLGCASAAETLPPPATSECGAAATHVRVRRTATWVSGAREVEGPYPFATPDLAAVVRDGDGYRELAGRVTAPGVFEADGVPDGEWAFRLGDSYTFTRARCLEQRFLVAGHADAPPISRTSTTILSLSVRGLSPWAFEDELEVASFDSGTFLWSALDLAGGGPAAGTVEALPVRMRVGRRGLQSEVRATRGDGTYVLQRSLVTGAPGLGQVRTVVRAGTVPPFDLVEGQEVSVTATLAEVPSASILVRWSRARFGEVLDAPGARVSLSVVAGPLASSGALVDWTSVLDTTDALLASEDGALEVRIGDPFPASFRRRVRANAWTDGRDTSTWVDVVDGVAEVAPRVGPPRDVRVNGVAVDVPARGLGTRWRVSWAPPAVGAATSYDVAAISRAVAPPWAFRVVTTSTSVLLPRDVASRGEITLRVIANGDGGAAGFNSPALRAD